MKNLKSYITVFAALVSLLLPSSIGWACNVCHSKNPKMVRMHKGFGMADCFSCHGTRKQQSPEELKAEMETDAKCTGCHKK